MNRFFLVIAVLITLSACASPNLQQGTGKHLFILSGQSNMARLNPSISFTPTVKSEFGASNVIVVKDAQGGQPIRRWFKNWISETGERPFSNGDLYDRLISNVKKAIIGSKLKTITFVWMQGESDAVAGEGEVYAQSLIGLINQLESDLERKDINVVIGRINDHLLGAKRTDWDLIRNTQVQIADSNTYFSWVNTDDLNGENNDLHLPPEGYRVLGKRFADKAIDLIKLRLRQSP